MSNDQSTRQSNRKKRRRGGIATGKGSYLPGMEQKMIRKKKPDNCPKNHLKREECTVPQKRSLQQGKRTLGETEAQCRACPHKKQIPSVSLEGERMPQKRGNRNPDR